DMVREILKKGYRGTKKTIYDKDPKRLVERLIKLIKKEVIMANIPNRAPRIIIF
ncbi:unnamed protein product, partial [marine sediment metagenome]